MWLAEPAGRWHRAVQQWAAQMNGGHVEASKTSSHRIRPIGLLHTFLAGRGSIGMRRDGQWLCDVILASGAAALTPGAVSSTKRA